MTLGAPRRGGLRDREAACVLFEALDAEQLFANGVLAIPSQRRPRDLQDATQERFQ
jgi:hypothetical protein